MKVIFKRFLLLPLIGILTCSFGNVPGNVPLQKPDPGKIPMKFFNLQCPLQDKAVYCSENNANHFLQLFKWEQNGENLVFNRRIPNADTTSYACFIQSIARENADRGIDWCPGNFSLMYSFPISGAYGKREYTRLTPENFAAFKVAIIQDDAHLHWVPYRWFPANASCQ